MKWFLYAISFIWIVIGSCTILYTKESRSTLKSLLDQIDRKFLSLLPLITGLLFILSAPFCRNSWFIRLLGITAIIKGGFIISNPYNLYSRLTDWYLKSLSDQTYRFFGIITLILGTAVLSWIL